MVLGLRLKAQSRASTSASWAVGIEVLNRIANPQDPAKLWTPRTSKLKAPKL